MSIEDFKIEKRTFGYMIRDYIGYDYIIKIPSHFNGN